MPQIYVSSAATQKFITDNERKGKFNMRKSAISWALTASMVLSMLSGFIPGQKAYAADSSK